MSDMTREEVEGLLAEADAETRNPPAFVSYYHPHRVADLARQLLTAWDERDAARKVALLHAVYESIQADRGGDYRPKGRAWVNFIEARDAALRGMKEG